MIRLHLRLLILGIVGILLAGFTPASAEEDVPPAEFSMIFSRTNSLILGEQDTLYARPNATLVWRLYAENVKFVWEKRDANAPGGYVTTPGITLPKNYDGFIDFQQKMPGSYTGKAFSYRARVFNLAGEQIALTGWQRYMATRTPYKASKSTYSRWSLSSRSRTRPSRWNPCADVTVKVDPRSVKNGSDARAIRDTKSAISYIRKHTGIRLVYTGTTKAGNSISSFSSSSDIVVKWVSGAPAGRVAGQAKSLGRGVAGVKDWYRMERAKVNIYTKYDKSSRRQHVLRHELLHALGAGHSKTNKDMMGPSSHKTTFQKGDKIVAQYVGSRAGCM